jgi:hypothetical protein
LKAGIVEPGKMVVAKQWLSKHVPAAKITNETIGGLLEAA